METVNSSKQVQTSNSIIPALSRTFTFTKTLVSGSTMTIDLTNQNTLNRLQNVQGVFIDNSLGAVPLIFGLTSGQNIRVPAGAQGTFPIYWPADYIVNLTGAGQVTITLVNFPTPVGVWGTPSIGTTQAVTDTTLLENNSSLGLKVSPILQGSGAYSYPSYAPDKFVSGSVTNSVTNLWGAIGTNYFLRQLKIWATPEYANAAPINLQLNADGVNIATVEVPAVANATGRDRLLFDVSGADIIGPGPLTVQLSASPASGEIVFSGCGASVSV